MPATKKLWWGLAAHEQASIRTELRPDFLYIGHDAATGH